MHNVGVNVDDGLLFGQAGKEVDAAADSRDL